jgi:Bacteriophage HK97-gp10, putative tail-component
MARYARSIKRTFEIKEEGSRSLKQQLEALGDPEFTRQVSRSAALAGAKVITERAKQLAPLYAGPPKNRYSAPGKISGRIIPGELRDSIYNAFTPEMSFGGTQFYSVSWNTAKVGYAHLIEFGHFVYNRKNGPQLGFAQPRSFIRKAADSTDKAFVAMRTRATERFNYLFTNYIQQGKPLPAVTGEEAE